MCIDGGWVFAKPTKKTEPKSIYQLKIVLLGIEPPIWRRLLVRDDTTLKTLDRIIQCAMGWTNSHLHRFDINGKQYSLPQFELENAMNSSRVKLCHFADRPKKKFRYEYDMGDSWQHESTVEQIVRAEPGQQVPICLDGARACPPEDCGGTWGYEELLEAMRDPKHERHGELMQWVGGSFDPEAFDLNKVNRGLKKIK